MENFPPKNVIQKSWVRRTKFSVPQLGARSPPLPNSISEFRLAVKIPKLNFKLRPKPKSGRNQNASYGRNRKHAETQKFGSFGAETVTETGCALVNMVGRN